MLRGDLDRDPSSSVVVGFVVVFVVVVVFPMLHALVVLFLFSGTPFIDPEVINVDKAGLVAKPVGGLERLVGAFFGLCFGISA